MKIVKTLATLAVAVSLVGPGLSFAAPQANKSPSTAQASINQAVNINQANEQSLETVVGLGPSKAKAIVAYRDKNGQFKSVEDLTNVPGIGDKLLARVKSQLTV